MIIVTGRLFVHAETIKSMDLSDNYYELDGNHYVRKHDITIWFTRVGSPDETEEVSVTFSDKNDALVTFKEIVRQYREQNPDQLYLDKILEKSLTVGTDYEEVEEASSYRNTKSRTPRKTKRKRK